jgi:hypothetical protein
MLILKQETRIGGFNDSVDCVSVITHRCSLERQEADTLLARMDCWMHRVVDLYDPSTRLAVRCSLVNLRNLKHLWVETVE